MDGPGLWAFLRFLGCPHSPHWVSKQGKALPHDPFTLGLGSSGGKHWIHSDNVLGMGGQKVAIKDYKRPKRQRKRSQQHPMFPGGHPSKYWRDSTLLNFSDRTRTGVFNVIWPLTLASHNYILFQPLSLSLELFPGIQSMATSHWTHQFSSVHWS